jgi:hypothetical protein
MLRRVLGDDRYYRFTAWAETHVGLVLGLGALALLSVAFPILWLVRPAPHSHDGYVTAEVLGTDTAASDETSFVFRAALRLSDGTTMRIGTESLELAQTVTDTACLERRVTQDGTAHYRFAQPARCTQ